MFSLEAALQNGVPFADAAQFVVQPRPPRSKQICFTKDDNDQLLEILEGRQSSLRSGKWGQVAKELGKFSGEQIREHWRSIGRRSQIAAITPEESRDIVRRQTGSSEWRREFAPGSSSSAWRSLRLTRG
jgi:hypothetical protein